MIRLLGRRPRTDLSDLKRLRRTAIANAWTLASPDLAVGMKEMPLPVRGGLRARRYDPAGEPVRAVVYFHGGGYVSGSPASHDALARRLSAALSAIVFSIDYGLAPESPAFSAFDDALAATRWIAAHGLAERGVLPFGVCGDSAGGGLAAAVALSLRGSPTSLAFLVLLWPWLDLRCTSDSHRLYGEGFLLETRWLKACAAAYAGQGVDDPRASPVLALDVGDLPPTYILTAGCDPLRSDSELWAARLKAAGVPVYWRVAEGLPHAFLLASDIAPEGVEAFDGLVAGLIGDSTKRGSASGR